MQKIIMPDSWRMTRVGSGECILRAAFATHRRGAEIFTPAVLEYFS
jgi:hypothetical protein